MSPPQQPGNLDWSAEHRLGSFENTAIPATDRTQYIFRPSGFAAVSVYLFARVQLFW
jgi:hypothetical protein